MARFLALPAGRRGKWVIFLVWLVAVFAMIGTNLPGKFSDAEENSSTSFLPGDAESTKALKVTEALDDGEVAPTIVVYRRAGGLTAADRRTIERDTEALNRVTRQYENTSPFERPVLSRDRTTALVRNEIRGTGEGSGIIDPVDDYRETLKTEEVRDGLNVKVAGPAGIAADAIKVFEGINGTLLFAAFGLVIFLLILIYRSPIFWFFPILAVAVAEITARAFGYGLSELGVTVNGQSSSILSILVIGAGTDYALLLVARYREELHKHQDKHEAMALALRQSGPAILASGLTVAAALMSLTLAKVNGTAGLGPIGAMGVLVAILVMLVFLPAVLTIVGRRRFWPFVPYGPEGPDAPDHVPMRPPVLRSLTDRFGPVISALMIVGALVVLANLAADPVAGLIAAAVVVGLVLFFTFAGRALDRGLFRRIEHRFSVGRDVSDELHGPWRSVGDWVAARPVKVALAGTALLVVMSLGLLNFSTGLTQSNSFRDDVESIAGQDLIALAFPSGTSAPTDIVLPDDRNLAAVAQAAKGVEGVAEVPPRPVNAGPEGVQLAAFLQMDPYSTEAYDVIPELRSAVREADPRAIVGGPTAVEVDLRSAATDDTLLLIPIALVIVFLILAALLRALLAPVLLIATVVLSFLAALGVGAIVFDVIFGFPGSDPSLPLFAFIFLVALGVDYNIFLMARVREETLKHGTRDGMLRGLAVTGGVITSAGIVLAGTFAVLGVLPLVFLTQIGFVIAFGVLLDTFLVRSVLVPAITFSLGPKIWWPSKLAREPAGTGPAPTASPERDSPPTPVA